MSADISGVDLTGQIAIVTGGPSARSVARSLESAGAIVTLVADVANRNASVQTVQKYRDQHGAITLVVNVAKAVEQRVPLWQIDPREWSNTLESDLRSTLLWTKAAIAEMANGGRIINIADASLVSHLMKNLAAEAQARKIEIISIDPASDPMQKLAVYLASGQLRSNQWQTF